ncbi:AC transposase [Ceratobasidium sp. AG-Ba]|nr:AC transposase [Ceratobasidium sp. AG-Ba]
MGSWITKDWHLEETLLDFVELHGAHDGQNMATAVASTLSELGISNKFLALVTDNASTNGTLARHLSSILDSSNQRWDSEKGQIRCLAHVIHLGVMCLLRGIDAVPSETSLRDFDPKDSSLDAEEAEGFVASDNKEALEDNESEEVDPLVNLLSAINKVRKISKLVRSSPQRMEFFRLSATQIEEGHEQKALAANRIYVKKTIKTLILDVSTRWNSVFLMLERALEFSETINYLTGHAKVAVYRPYALSFDEWAAVALFFRSASTIVAAEKYPTLSFSLRVYFLLISYVLDLEKSPELKRFPQLSAGVSACKDKLLEYFDKSTYDSEYYYFATILDPRFKDSLFKSHKGLTGKLFSRDWINGCAESLVETFNEFYRPHEAKIEPLNSAIGSSQPEDTGLDEFTRAWKAQLSFTPRSRRPNAKAGSIASEISQYLDEDTTTLSPLVWWRINAERFPRLAAMARDFLCIPGTSVAVERVFNVGRDVISLRRASLNAETIRMLMTYRAGIVLEKQIAKSHAE